MVTIEVRYKDNVCATYKHCHDLSFEDGMLLFKTIILADKVNRIGIRVEIPIERGIEFDIERE